MKNSKYKNEDPFKNIDEKISKNYRRRNLIHYNDWFKNFRPAIARLLMILLPLFFIYIAYYILVVPPRYSNAESASKEKELMLLVNAKAPDFKPLFIEALNILREHPRYYNKVVNNIQDIEIKTGVCPYACVYFEGFSVIYGISDMISETFLPETNKNLKTLIINPKGAKRYNNGIKFASMLVHETDHVEHLESSRLRRLALFIKCNPLLNPNISIFSTLSTITHRVEIIEICAEKERIKFHKATETPSGYATNTGIVIQILRFFYSLLASMLSLIKSFFAAFFSDFI